MKKIEHNQSERALSWWKNLQPPEGSKDLRNISTDDFVSALTNGLLSDRGIINLPRQRKKTNTAPLVENEEKKTWQPNASWREPIPIISGEGIVDEVVELLEDAWNGTNQNQLNNKKTRTHAPSAIDQDSILKKTIYDPNDSWRSVPPILLDAEVMKEAEMIVEGARYGTGQDLLPFVVSDYTEQLCQECDRLIFDEIYSTYQDLFNEIARTAMHLEIFGRKNCKGENLLSLSAWQQLEEYHGKMGMLLVLIELCGIDTLVKIVGNQIFVQGRLSVPEDTLLGQCFPTVGYILSKNNKKNTQIPLAIAEYLKNNRYVLGTTGTTHLFSMSQYPQWLEAVQHADGAELTQLVSINWQCDINNEKYHFFGSNQQTKKTPRFGVALELELPKSNEPPLLVSNFGAMNFDGSLNPQSVVYFLQLFNGAKVRYKTTLDRQKFA